MYSKRDRGTLVDICAAVADLSEFTEGMTLETFRRDKKTYAAAIRQILLIGEASLRLSKELKDSIPTIPWADVKGMRNILVHEYDGIEPILVWDVSQRLAPELRRQIEDFLSRD